jgi:RsiW-degrading membrane proteinase PrsW (M82 family)
MDAGTATLLIIFASIAPAIFLLWYFYRTDKWEREPFALILGVFLGGCIVAGIVAGIALPFLTSYLQSFGKDEGSALVGSFLIAIVGQPLLWGVVRFGVFNRKQFNEPVDGIVYGAAAGLGFAVVLNIAIFVTLLTFTFVPGRPMWVETGKVDVVTQVVLPSLLFAIPLQALFSAISCYCLGIAKFTPAGQGRNFTIFAGLFVAILLQLGWIGSLLINNPALSTPNGLALWYFETISFAVAAWVLITGRIDAALNRSPYNPSRSAVRPASSLINRIVSATNPVRSLQGRLASFCPRCGTSITRATRFCPKGGAPTSAEAESSLSALESDISNLR